MNVDEGIKALRARGFVFQAVPDQSGDVCVIVGLRGWPDCHDRLHIWDEDQAIAARVVPGMRHGADDVVWTHEDTATGAIEALLDLPGPDAPGAPHLARRPPSGLWLPPSAARA